MGAQVSPRQTFKEYLKFFPSRRDERTEMIQDLIVGVGVHAFVHAAVEVVRRADIQLPEVFRLPSGESLWTNRFHVGVRKQADHFEAVRSANRFRELGNRAGIVDVRAKGRAHVEVMFDQKQHRLLVGGRQIQAFETRFRDRQAGRDRIVYGDSLSGIVEQDCKIEQLGLLEFMEDRRVPLVPFGLGLAEGMQIFDNLKGVLIDSEAMQRVAHGERINAFKLRQEYREQMQGVHGSESVRGVRIRQYFLEKTPEIAALRQLVRQQRKCLLHLMFRCRAELEAALGNQAN